jgi:hypothetical protein
MRVIAHLTEQEFHRLQELAINERRPLKDQAAWLLSQALKAADRLSTNEVSDSLEDRDEHPASA